MFNPSAAKGRRRHTSKIERAKPRRWTISMSRYLKGQYDRFCYRTPIFRNYHEFCCNWSYFVELILLIKMLYLVFPENAVIGRKMQSNGGYTHYDISFICKWRKSERGDWKSADIGCPFWGATESPRTFSRASCWLRCLREYLGQVHL